MKYWNHWNIALAKLAAGMFLLFLALRPLEGTSFAAFVGLAAGWMQVWALGSAYKAGKAALDAQGMPLEEPRREGGSEPLGSASPVRQDAPK